MEEEVDKSLHVKVRFLFLNSAAVSNNHGVHMYVGLSHIHSNIYKMIDYVFVHSFNHKKY